MLTIFNRRKLIAVISMQKLFRIREVLSQAGIPCHIKTTGIGAAAASRRHGMPVRSQDSAYTYVVYFQKEAYDCAIAVIQPALRGD